MEVTVMDVGPTAVAIYDVGFAQARKVAEFQLVSDGTAVLTVTDPAGCLVAEQWYARGVPVDDPLSRIGPGEGAQFLRALLETPGMSYYRVVDETPMIRRTPLMTRRRETPIAGSRRHDCGHERQYYPRPG